VQRSVAHLATGRRLPPPQGNSTGSPSARRRPRPARRSSGSSPPRGAAWTGGPPRRPRPVGSMGPPRRASGPSGEVCLARPWSLAFLYTRSAERRELANLGKPGLPRDAREPGKQRLLNSLHGFTSLRHRLGCVTPGDATGRHRRGGRGRGHDHRRGRDRDRRRGRRSRRRARGAPSRRSTRTSQQLADAPTSATPIVIGSF
jgi:hypothetical protein